MLSIKANLDNSAFLISPTGSFAALWGSLLLLVSLYICFFFPLYTCFFRGAGLSSWYCADLADIHLIH